MAASLRSRRRISPVEWVSTWWAGQGMAVRAVVIVALLAFAVWFPSTLELRWQSVLFFPVAVYVLLALGLNVVVGQAGLLDLGYVAFYAVGAYTTAKITTATEINVWAVLPLAIAMAMFAGVILGGPTLRLRGDYLAIVTLGFGEIVRIAAQNSESLGATRGITGIPHPTSIGSVDFAFDPLPYYYLTLAACVLAIAMVVRLNRSRVGRAWVAVREDEDAAELMGVPTFKFKLWAFAIGASTGGLAGWIYASKVSFINPDNFPFFLSVLILAGVVLGGMGSIPGVIAGAFLIAFLPEYLRNVPAGEKVLDILNAVTGGQMANVLEYRVFLFGLALVITMVFRPQGLLPSRQRAAELAEATSEAQSLGVSPHLEEVAPDDGAERSEGAQPASVPQVDPEVDLPEDAVQRAAEVAETVLSVTDVTMSFGGVTALHDVSIEVNKGQIFGIIGPNGAGKTTLFNCITGVFEPTEGSIVLDGSAIIGRKPHKITAAGVARTFQNIRLFSNMTAVENVLVGTDARHTSSVPGALAYTPKHRREEKFARGEAMRLLEFVGIAHRRDELARNLPYGDQRRLEIARALATQPKVLLLDEPAAGFNPAEKSALMDLIRQIRDQGLTVILIEHDMGLVMKVCDRIAVLDFGEKIAEGDPVEIQRDPRVIAAYLGVAADAAS